jgi:hypothetical protein
MDHLVLATPDLAATVAWFATSTGVAPSRGGQHLGLGSANYLVGLGGRRYLEVVGPDPDQSAPAGARPFGFDLLSAASLVMARRTATGELLERRLTPPTATYRRRRSPNGTQRIPSRPRSSLHWQPSAQSLPSRLARRAA